MLLLILSVSITVTGLCSAIHAVLSKRDSKSALTWVIICIGLPLIGPLTYLIFGINRVYPKTHDPYPLGAVSQNFNGRWEPSQSNHGQFSSIGGQITGMELRPCEEICVLENGEQFYPSALSDIKSATKSIYLCTYIFRNDRLGKEILHSLESAHDRGVEVRLILDGLGAIAYRPAILSRLRESNLSYRLFNPLRIVPPSLHVNMRNHRKILLIDGSIAYTGGQNISARHLLSSTSKHGKSRDLHFRLKGKIVEDLYNTFITDWNYCSDSREALPATYSEEADTESKSDISARLVLDGPNQNLDKINELLVGIVSAAKTRVWIITPYFLPGLDLLGALTGARLRGVDVKILMPERTNIYLAHWASQHNLKFVLMRKLDVYLVPPPFVHTKAILIDQDYALVGSANLDPRSLRLNFELDLEVFNPRFNATLSVYFTKLLRDSTYLNSDRLNARPKWVQLRDGIAWLFTPYL